MFLYELWKSEILQWQEKEGGKKRGVSEDLGGLGQAVWEKS